jgi:hypothetical protein
MRYATANRAHIARRMLEMRPPIVVTLCNQGRVRWRRSNVAARLPRLLPVELNAWRDCHSSGQRARALFDPFTTGLESVRVRPIHETDWKREILRSEIAEW